MTKEQFAIIRKQAGLSFQDLGRLLRIDDVRTLQRYEEGERPISGPVSILMELIATGQHG